MSLTEKILESTEKQLTEAIRAKNELIEANTKLRLKNVQLELDLKNLREVHAKMLEESIELNQQVQTYLELTKQLEKK